MKTLSRATRFLTIFLFTSALLPPSLPAQSPPRINIPVADEIPGTPVLVVHQSASRQMKIQDREALGQLSRRVIVAAWADGTVVWSPDDLNGGEPYFMAQVGPEKVTAVLAEICESAQALPDDSHTTRFGPDSSYHSITVRSDACDFDWHSWHELYEGGRVVAVDGALTVLPEGRDPEEYRRERSSAEYLQFMDSWNAVREAARSLIPPDRSQHTPALTVFQANWVLAEGQEAPPPADAAERERIASEAVDRLTEDVVNIYTSDWMNLPEPEFITKLMAAIDEGRFAEPVWMAARANDVALRRLHTHTDIVYPLFRRALEDPIAPHVLGRTVLTLPPEYQAAVLTDIRESLARDAFAPKKEEFLHAGLIGRADLHEPFWLDFAKERFRHERTPLNARIAAGAAVYSTMDPDEMLAEVQAAEGSARDAAVGALSRLLAQTMTNTVLGSAENLEAARPLIVEALKSEESELRKWAAFAARQVATGMENPDPDPEMMEAIRAAFDAEQEWQIREALGKGLRELKEMYGVE